MKTLACRDAGVACDYVAKGNTEEDVIGQAKQHAMQAHNYKESDFTPQMKDKMRGFIKEEGARAAS